MDTRIPIEIAETLAWMDFFFHEIYLPRKSASQPPLNSISTVTNVSPVFSSRVSFSFQHLSFQHRASIFSPIEFHFFFRTMRVV